MTPPKTDKQTKNNQQQKQNKKQQLPFSVKCIEPHRPSHWKCALQKLFIVVVVIINIIMNVKRLLCNTVFVLLHCLVKTE